MSIWKELTQKNAKISYSKKFKSNRKIKLQRYA